MAILEVVFLVVFWAWIGAALLFLRNTILPRLPLVATPEQFSLPFEAVQFQATDGVRLEGWKISSDASRPWIILCHGLGANRSDLLDVAAGLHQARFNLLLFDFRGHGHSAGRATSFGWQEQRDLEGALAFLGQQPEALPRPYGVYGISMGGSVALIVAGRDERLGAVAVDSVYTDLEESLSRHLNLLYPVVPKIPFLWFVLSTYRLRFGIWPRHVSPLEGAGQLGTRPLLVIHGASDSRMPAEGARRLVAGSRTGELWIVEGAGHGEAFSINPTAYLSRLVAFFESSLK